jgi:CheY-like chemotaxis protein
MLTPEKRLEDKPPQDRKAPTILVVDDEETIIASLRGLFTLETEYSTIGFTSPEEALKKMDGAPVDLVISDLLMPRMNGIEFLKEARRLQPDAPRILLTGFADKENAVRAINEVGLYQYLEKPWDNDALLMAVRNALNEKNLQKQLSEKIGALDKLISEHDALSNRHQALERELEMAARVQRSLLPARMPRFAGWRFHTLYRPSYELGGDFYDYHLKPSGAIVIVSDVSGHGVKAALTTMLLKAIFLEAAMQDLSLTGILTEMNQRLIRILPEGLYVAAALLEFEAGSERVQFANAGMPYPFVLRGDSGEVDEIVATGLAPGSVGRGAADRLWIARDRSGGE